MQAQARICPVCYDDHSAIYACENDNLLEAIATRDAEIERLRADLVWAVRQGVMVSHDENLRPCVWFDVHRGVECDGTPESICRAVREARGDG